MAKRALIAIVAAIVVLVTVQLDVGTASVGQTGGNDVTCQPAPPPPMPPASDFGSRVDNKYFPLEPGTTLVYRGYEGRHRSLDIVTVLHRTKTILGIMATVVADRVILDGHRSEKTFDWYAQDRPGNVWYVGEAAFDLKHHHWVRAPDSWEAGRKGAVAGIIMEAHSRVGDTYRQEYRKGHAEDMAR